MARRIVEIRDDYHIEQRTLTRSFDTLEAAQKFAEGKEVRDIFRFRGRYKVEWVKNNRVDHYKRIIFDGEVITPETAMKWFCWHELVSAMEKNPGTLKDATIFMNSPQQRNAPDWEYRFLMFFLEIAKEDLVIR